MKEHGREGRVAPLMIAATHVAWTIGGALGAPALAQSSEAGAPTYAIGDEWRFSFGPAKVVAIDGSQSVMEFPANKRCPGCRYFFDGQRTLSKVVDKDGNQVNDLLVGLKVLDFPLSVGKEWHQTTNFFNEQTNRSLPMTHSFRVLAQEEVKTKAGTLKAFKISHSRDLQTSVGNLQGRRDWGTAVYWYSPEARAIVKREVMSTGAVRAFGSDYELESYSLK